MILIDASSAEEILQQFFSAAPRRLSEGAIAVDPLRTNRIALCVGEGGREIMAELMGILVKRTLEEPTGN